jgi:uncharacterized membrane protein YfcA
MQYKYIFQGMVVGVFVGASVTSFFGREPGKGWFYLLSALINVNIMFLKG